jgi:hypothetical protein
VLLTCRPAPWRKPRAVHDPGKVLLDVALAVTLGRGLPGGRRSAAGRTVVFGPVAPDPTASRPIDALAAGGKRALTALR